MSMSLDSATKIAWRGKNQTFVHRFNISTVALKTSFNIPTPPTPPHTMARDLAPDWILQETLAIQAQTAQWFKDKQAEHAGQKPLTLTVLGCGMRHHHLHREAVNTDHR
jgi:hypothetical protein